MNLNEQVDAMRQVANEAENHANDLEANLYRMRGAQLAAVDKAEHPAKMPEHLMGQFHYWYGRYGDQRQRIMRAMEELSAITYVEGPATLSQAEVGPVYGGPRR
jgi:hypothetical protein